MIGSLASPSLDAEGGIENTDASTGKLGPACLGKLEQLAPR